MIRSPGFRALACDDPTGSNAAVEPNASIRAKSRREIALPNGNSGSFNGDLRTASFPNVRYRGISIPNFLIFL